MIGEPSADVGEADMGSMGAPEMKKIRSILSQTISVNAFMAGG
jgi:hypothetical protein